VKVAGTDAVVAANVMDAAVMIGADMMDGIQGLFQLRKVRPPLQQLLQKRTISTRSEKIS